MGHWDDWVNMGLCCIAIFNEGLFISFLFFSLFFFLSSYSSLR